jgi:hypothetical protein
MIIVGLLLLIAALIFGVELVFGNHHLDAHSPVVFGQSLAVHNEAALFVVGVITGAAILIGLSLIASGFRFRGARAATRYRDNSELVAARDERDALAAENVNLKAELERERASNRTLADEAPAKQVPATPVTVVVPRSEVPVVRDDSAGQSVYR